jgi:hypothetical protein
MSPLTPLNHDILVVSHLLGDPVSPAALRSMQGCSHTLACGCSRSHLPAHTDRWATRWPPPRQPNARVLMENQQLDKLQGASTGGLANQEPPVYLCDLT